MKPINRPDAPEEHCSPYLTFNKDKFVLEVDAALTLDERAWGKYEYELILKEPDSRGVPISYYTAYLSLEITPPDARSIAFEAKSKININAPWAQFYDQNKGKLPYKMSVPTEA